MKRIAIKNICEVYDGPHATPKKTETGPVYLGIDAITEDGMLDSSQFSYLSKEDYIKWTKRVVPQENDIVFSYEATLGKYALIPSPMIITPPIAHITNPIIFPIIISLPTKPVPLISFIIAYL